MDGQTQIPSVKTDNDSLNQVQQNINKVFRNVSTQLSNIQSTVDGMSIVGEIKLASLTLSQFQSIAGQSWILANGQSCVGTTYSALTLNNTVPNISVTGATAFIKVN